VKISDYEQDTSQSTSLNDRLVETSSLQVPRLTDTIPASIWSPERDLPLSSATCHFDAAFQRGWITGCVEKWHRSEFARASIYI